MKVFISQPMKDKTDEEILTEKENAIKAMEHEFEEEVEIIDSFFKGAPEDARPLWYLGKSIQLLSTADVALFIGDWKNYRGCKIEHTCAKEYGIRIMEYTKERIYYD